MRAGARCTVWIVTRSSLCVLAAVSLVAVWVGVQRSSGQSADAMIAFTVWDAGISTLYVVSAGGGQPRRLGGRSTGENFVWSPDGRRVAFEKRRQQDYKDVHVMAADGSSRGLLARFAQTPAWSPDGKLIAFVNGNDSIHVIAPDGSGLRDLVPPRAGVTGMCCPVWSPDGRAVAFSNFLGREGIYIVAADGSRLRWLVGQNAGLYPSWSPDGDQLAFTRHPLYGADAYAIGSNGRGLRRLARELKFTQDPAWSGDGRRIAFKGTLERGARAAIYTVLPGDGGLKRLTPDRLGRSVGDPRWSPDGQRIAFTAGGSIYVMSADGVGLRAVARGDDPHWVRNR